MWQKALLVLVASTTTFAQAPPGPQQRTGSVSGVVRDASTEAPLSGVHVSVPGDDRTTDSQGRFAFEEVEPGSQRIRAWDQSRGAYGGVDVLVSPGQAAKAEIRLKLGGAITGRVVDEDRQPVAGAMVLLLSRRYEHGELAYSPSQTVAAGRDGGYRLEGVLPERPFLILAKKPLKAIDASEPPSADPDKRERVVLPSLYPNAGDVRDLKLLGRSAPSISGELAFDPPPRDKPGEIQVSLMRYVNGGGGYADSAEKPATFGAFGGLGTGHRVPAPGAFDLGRVQIGDWQLRLPKLPEGCYLKEASYGSQNVLHAPLRLAQAAGGERLRLVIGCDGGALTARVMDKDGNTVSHAVLYLMAAHAPSEGALAESLRRADVVRGWSAPLGGIPPGKYLALATGLDLSPEYAPADDIEKLWRARSSAKEVEIGPGAMVQITLEPLKID
jgi:hypothetical protein